MNIIETKEISVSTVTDVICNKCGKSCKLNHGFFGLINAVVSGGSNSPALEDLMHYRFSLCEPCVKWLFDAFMHEPEKAEEIVIGEDPFDKLNYERS